LKRNLKAFNRVKGALDTTAYFLEFHKVQAPLYWYDPLYDGSDLWKGIELNADVIVHFVPLVYDDHDASDAFHRIRVPVFLALGQYDFATPPSLWNSYINTFQDITVKRYSRSSHYPMIDEREAFDRDVIQWLSLPQEP
jgi:pimeloyl-ACP methyl ester carboxylesterase